MSKHTQNGPVISCNKATGPFCVSEASKLCISTYSTHTVYYRQLHKWMLNLFSWSQTCNWHGDPFSGMCRVQVDFNKDASLKVVNAGVTSDKLKGSSEENEFHVCVRVCGVEGRGKRLSRQFSFVCEKDNPEESSKNSLGGMTRPDDKMGSQIDRVTPASPGPVF